MFETMAERCGREAVRIVQGSDGEVAPPVVNDLRIFDSRMREFDSVVIDYFRLGGEKHAAFADREPVRFAFEYQRGTVDREFD